jgi:hypothetical protein
MGTKADQDQHRPGPAQTEGQSPLSQADQDQRLNVDVSSTRGVEHLDLGQYDGFIILL